MNVSIAGEPPLPNQPLSSWLQYIEAVNPRSIEMGLDRVDAVRHKMGLAANFPVITVGGTNGKGSTCAMLETIYSIAGYRVGCYTSPHFIRYNERVRIHRQEASDQTLVKALEEVEKARGRIPLTYFEFSTLAAVWLFIQENIEVAILEVGLGGRLDAVNVFEPDCTIVTSVDLDHMEYLGDTRELIGAEKAGIFRSSKPAITGDVDPPKALKERAEQLKADYIQLGKQMRLNIDLEHWDFMLRDARFENLPKPGLDGQFQLNNAACVLAAIVSLQNRLPVDLATIRVGLESTRLAGRFQKISNNPEVILDVAHNPQAARALSEILGTTHCKGKTIAVFGMLADKDITKVIEALQERIDVWYVAGIQATRGATTIMMQEIFGHANVSTQVIFFADVKSAYDQACFDAMENDRIIAFGSFYTVADVMAAEKAK